ncbi:hypothetical protein Ddye_031862 [Dipteronia dyeriana]|uniref:FAD/NAD(P)-binding oxidoreductase family protein n=1 Tax=Dipteronia dyeriana TaxID=168575 RepID=A0AAD9TJ50_9ROSI|nr:hypothetical protein Ddye_031862 [Dipteronia dyeriana]
MNRIIKKGRITSSHVESSGEHPSGEEVLVVVGGGAAGIVAPKLNVVVIVKGKPLSKVRISGVGRCNVTNGHCADNKILAERTLVVTENLETEDDGRVFPVSNISSSIIDCLLSEAKQRGNRKSCHDRNCYCWSRPQLIEKRTINLVECFEADYLLIASGNSKQGYSLAAQLGHSIVDPVPSLFTFKIVDSQLTELSGVTFQKVVAKLKFENVGPMLVTHWGLSGPVILRLSAWGARDLFTSSYKWVLTVVFIPDLHLEEMKSILSQHKHLFAVLNNAYPSEFGILKRFWKYILVHEGTCGDTFWASISNNSLIPLLLLRHCTFDVTGKGQFKDEFITAGGIPLSEIYLNTMESKIRSHLFFAGEVLNVDGVTGGFNFQNAWSGGYIAGTSIGKLANEAPLKEGSI